MSAIKDAVANFFGVDLSLERLHRELARLAAEDSALHAEWDSLLTADPVAADVEAGARRVLGAARAALIAQIGPAVIGALAGGFAWGGKEVTRLERSDPFELMPLPAPRLALLLDFEGLVRACVALAPAQGLTLEQRARRLAAIPGERAAIQREHAALVDRAAELGIQVPHLPEVATQRNAARLARERAAQLAADDARNDRLRGH